MKINLYSFGFLFFMTSASFISLAQDDAETEYKTMDQMLGSVKLEKKQIESMVDNLVSSGRIKPEEAQDAKRALASMNESDLEELKNAAVSEIKSKKLLDH